MRFGTGSRALFREIAYEASVYGHFGHGWVHCRVNFELTTAGGIATYRAFDELLNLFPHDEDAKRLQKLTFTLAEILTQRAPDYPIPELRRNR